MTGNNNKRLWIFAALLAAQVFCGLCRAESPCDLESLFRAREPVFDATNIAKLIPPEASTLAWFSSGIVKSYILMYEATENTYYLDRIIQLGDRLWSVRSSSPALSSMITKTNRTMMAPA